MFFQKKNVSTCKFYKQMIQMDISHLLKKRGRFQQKLDVHRDAKQFKIILTRIQLEVKGTVMQIEKALMNDC